MITRMGIKEKAGFTTKLMTIAMAMSINRPGHLRTYRTPLIRSATTDGLATAPACGCCRGGCGTSINRSGVIAMAAVTTSIIKMTGNALTLKSSAPSAGAAICISPYSVWLSPATRDRSRSGTISDVLACIAGQ